MRLFEPKYWHKIQVFTILFLIFLAGLSSGYVWRMIHEINGGYSIQYVMTPDCKKLFDQKTNYHGLFYGQAVHQDSLGWYFIRDGQRCPF